ncbi:MAG: cell division protein FtsL [Thermodesulfobacteriota bacterium]
MGGRKSRYELNRLTNRGSGVRIHNSRKKERELRLTSRQIVLISILFLIFMMSGIGYVWSNFEGTQIGYDLSRLQKQEMELIELHRKLKLELAFLTSPQYLESAAGRAGLSPPDPDQVIMIQ